MASIPVVLSRKKSLGTRVKSDGGTCLEQIYPAHVRMNYNSLGDNPKNILKTGHLTYSSVGEDRL